MYSKEARFKLLKERPCSKGRKSSFSLLDTIVFRKTKVQGCSRQQLLTPPLCCSKKEKKFFLPKDMIVLGKKEKVQVAPQRNLNSSSST
jgi:hypothetical protein